MMPTHQTLRLLSVLLDYPDDEMLKALDQIAAAGEKIAEPEFKTAVRDFLAYLRTNDPLHLQENYTAAFDLRPATTLNLSYHAHGDNEKRAAALAQLQNLYYHAGWERTGGELPDHLPLMLEFLALHSDPATLTPVWQYLQAANRLAESLEATAPAYAALLHPIGQAAAAVVRNNDRVSTTA